jgi:hypothetical protein
MGEVLLAESTEAKFDIRNLLVWLNKCMYLSIQQRLNLQVRIKLKLKTQKAISISIQLILTVFIASLHKKNVLNWAICLVSLPKLTNLIHLDSKRLILDCYLLLNKFKHLLKINKLWQN